MQFKTLKKVLFYMVLILVTLNGNLKAQIPGADTIRDNYGRKYKPEEVRLDKVIGTGTNVTAAYPTSCTAGYFELHYETGSGMEGPTALEIARRNVVCQVFTDLSNWINSPLTSNTNSLTNKVKIAVRAFSTFSASSSILGLGGHIVYGIPNPAGSSFIWDNEVWKTINGGVNSLSSMAFPIGGGTSMYHGYVTFNFSSTVCPTFNYTLTSPPSPSEYDFYHVVLHEATHVLGIFSYINWNGQSIITPGAPFYSRYDGFLRSGINNQPYIVQNNNCGPAFIQYNPATPPNNHISPGSSTCGTLPSTTLQTITNCANSAKFAGTSYTTPVYTPDCYNVSSFSHFDDKCIAPPQTNTYFVMSKSTFCGTTSYKRYLKKEEASALCDLGYSLKNNFGNAVNLNAYTYTLTCGASVAGVNDGITSGTFYNIVTTAGVATSPIFPLSNDAGATTYTCLQIVNGSGSLSNTSGNGSFVYTPSTTGVHILEYVPMNSAGKKGNITYVYIFVKENCPMNCSISSNGGFENATGCGFGQQTCTQPFYHAYCWYPNQGTPDLLVRSCIFPGAALPISAPGGSFDSPTGPGTGNDHVMNILPKEGVQNQLSAPLVPGNVYQLSFKYLLTRNIYANEKLMVLGSDLPSGPGVSISSTNIPSYYHNFAVVSSTVPFTWVSFVTTFTYNATFTCNYLSFIGDVDGFTGYAIDDVLLTQVSTSLTPVAFNMPSNICVGQGLSNLMAYITPTNAMTQTGTFSGPGVALHGGIWSLNTNGITPGTYIYSFVYSNTITGCTYTTYASVNMNPVPTLTISGVNSNSVCLMPGVTSTTLMASGSPTNMSYAWAPGSIANMPLIVSPTVTTTYTLSASTGLCGNTKTITVTVLPPVTFNGSLPPVLCTGSQSIDLTGGLSSPTPTLGNWYASGLTGTVGVYTYSDATNHCWAYAPNTLTGPGIYTLTYVSTAFAGCSTTAQYTVEVRNTPTLTTNGPLSHCTNVSGYPALTLQANSTSTLPMTYTWNPGGLSGPTVAVSPTATTLYTVVGSDGYCVSVPNILEVVSNSACCGGTSTGAPWQYITSGTLGTATLNGLYAINQNLVINGNVKLNGEFYMAPNVTIKVLYNSSINSSFTYTLGGDVHNAKAHLLSCNAMWNGIVVDTYGEVKFEEGDLIEDAKTAISSSNSQNNFAGTGWYEINLDKVVFNRNKIGVSISNYTYTPAGGYSVPFKINGCVFTSRSFTYVPMYVSAVPSWPMYTPLTTASTPTNPLATPYLLGNLTPANLKAPSTPFTQNIGVYVENSGRTTNPTLSNTTYTTINVGDNSVPYTTLGIFDNLNIGICALNSNVASFGNVFQNTRAIPITTANPYYWGTGISASNNDLYGYNYAYNYVNLTATQNPTVNINRFYECEYGVHVQNIFQLNMKYAEFRSTQSKVAPPGQLQYTGLWIEGNRFKEYFVNNNRFLNLAFGIALSTYPGVLNVTGSNIPGQLWGTVNIRQNYFSPVSSPTVASLGNNFMSYGVICNNLIFSKTPQPLGAGFYTLTPYNGLWVADNTFDRVYRGVLVSSFNNSAFGKFVANNTISIVPDHVATNSQFGAAALNNYNPVYNSNYISGYTVSPTTTLSGIYFSMNTTCATKCNTLMTLPRGIEFAGLNSGAQWRVNTMTVNARGMQLSNNGIIGQQGSVNSPNDNYWGGSWIGNSFNIYTSNSISSSSKIYKRSLPGYDPQNLGGNPFPWNSSDIINASNSANWPPCVYGVPGKGPGGSKSGVALKVANGSMPYLGSYIPETEEINRFLLYDDLLGDTCLLNSNPVLQNFFAMTQSSEIGQLNQIEETLATGDLANAYGFISSFVPGSAIQSNYLQFYDLCLRFLDEDQVLSSQDSADIDVLAHKCPFVDGAIVYNARALNVLVNKVILVYNDAGCDGSEEYLESGGGDLERKVRNFEDQEKITADSYKLFPNPAKDILYLLGINENEGVDIEIKDVNNRVLIKTKVDIRNYTGHLKLDLINGVYFVSLKNKGNETIIKKLVISK